MKRQLLTNKMLLIGLAIVALLGLLFISFNAAQNNATPTTSPTQETFQPKTATLPPSVKDHPVTGQIIVKFKPQYTDAQINAHLQQYHASIIKTIEGINQTVVKVPAGKEDTISQKLRNDPYAQQVQRDYTTHAFLTPNDPLFSLQYAFNNNGQSVQGKVGNPHSDIHIEDAWNVTQGNGVKVAVLDTGINLNHPDLASKVILQKSFVSTTVEDGNGHGTHVAGILAADTNNSAGVAGTCPECQLIIGKVLDDSGDGTTSNATAGITWAADNGAKVINMSLGTTDTQTASLYAQAVNYAMSKGAVVIAAAGNDGNSLLNYPAATAGVISVAATTNQDQKASYSNFGSYVEIAAPGDNILSTGPTHAFQLQPFGYSTSSPYMYLSGTSMATPYVSGVAALVASTTFGTTPQALTNRLYSTADKISGTGNSWKNGRINAALAVGAAPTATIAPQPTSITPTLFCVGGNGTPPCATIPPAGSTPTIVPPVSGTNPTVALVSPAAGVISPTLETNPSISSAPGNGGNPPTKLPCSTSSIAVAVRNLSIGNYQFNPNSKVHIKDADDKNGRDNDGRKQRNNMGQRRGLLSRLFQFLLQLLQLLLQLISQCIPATPGGTPSATPVASIAPAISPSISESTSPTSPSITVSPQPQTSPTIFASDAPSPSSTISQTPSVSVAPSTATSQAPSSAPTGTANNNMLTLLNQFFSFIAKLFGVK